MKHHSSPQCGVARETCTVAPRIVYEAATVWLINFVLAQERFSGPNFSELSGVGPPYQGARGIPPIFWGLRGAPCKLDVDVRCLVLMLVSYFTA